LIPAGENSSFEYNVFPELLAREKQFFRLCHERQLLARHRNAGQLPASSSRFFRREIKGFKIDKSTESTWRQRQSLINIRFSATAASSNRTRGYKFVVGAGVHIEEQAVVENSVVWAHTRVSSQAQIRNAIVGAVVTSAETRPSARGAFSATKLR
jgi:NDP-sugar pyrophosphorylase family protein